MQSLRRAAEGPDLHASIPGFFWQPLLGSPACLLGAKTVRCNLAARLFHALAGQVGLSAANVASFVIRAGSHLHSRQMALIRPFSPPLCSRNLVYQITLFPSSPSSAEEAIGLPDSWPRMAQDRPGLVQ